MSNMTDYSVDTRKLKINTRDFDLFIYIDSDRFNLVSHCQWYLVKGGIINGAKVTIEEALGLPPKQFRDKRFARFDYRSIVYL